MEDPPLKSPLQCFIPNISWHKEGIAETHGILTIDIRRSQSKVSSAVPTTSGDSTDQKMEEDTPMVEKDGTDINGENSVMEVAQPQPQNADSEPPKAVGTPNEVINYRMVTANHTDVRMWDFCFEMECKPGNDKATPSLRVDFIANLRDSTVATLNTVRFSPNGLLLASGDTAGRMKVYKQRNGAPQPCAPKASASGLDELPPNKENWTQHFILRHGDANTGSSHSEITEVTCLAFSPDSSMIASVSMDRTLICCNLESKKKIWGIKSHRYIVVGMCWDPRGKYLVTLSTNRYFDIIDTKKGHRLQSCCQVELPETLLDAGNKILPKVHKLFYDDQLMSYSRGIDWSPCGSLILAPAACLETEQKDLNGCLVFRRSELQECKPAAMFPTAKPTIMVKFSPMIYKLRDDADENMLGLPHRVVWAVMCKASVLLYDSQHRFPISRIANIQYADLTSLAWTPDGKVLVVSSLEGYNTFVTVDDNLLGETLPTGSLIPPCYATDEAPDSPKLKRKEKEKKENNKDKEKDQDKDTQEETTKEARKKKRVRKVKKVESGEGAEGAQEVVPTPS